MRDMFELALGKMRGQNREQRSPRVGWKRTNVLLGMQEILGFGACSWHGTVSEASKAMASSTLKDLKAAVALGAIVFMMLASGGGR